MADFDRALKVVLKWEGGFVNHADDPGGATHHGVTRETLRQWRGGPVSVEDVRALTLEEAREIFKTLYWEVCRCGDMDWPAALMVFDAAVNHGPRQAARFLQRVVGAPVDGTIGPVTLAATRALQPETIAEEVAARRMAFYGELASFGVFGFGWSRRLMNILRVCVGSTGPDADAAVETAGDTPEPDPDAEPAPEAEITIPYAPGRGPGQKSGATAVRRARVKESPP